MNQRANGTAIGVRGRWGLGRRDWDDHGTPIRTESPNRQALRRLLRNRLSAIGLAILAVIVILVVVGPLVWTTSPTAQDLSNSLASSSSAHPLGTDTNGRDVLARLLHGGRISIAIALASVAGAAIIGTLIGLVAGFIRGLVDGVLMRIMDVMLAFPPLMLAITIVAIAGPGMLSVIVAVGVPSVPFFARLTRSVVLSVREREYVLAARASGVRRSRILTRHVLRNSLSPIIVASALTFGLALVEVATLGFLGLGVQSPQAEWGAMLADANQYLFSNPAVLVVPGLAITLTAVAGNLVGDALNDALNPTG